MPRLVIESKGDRIVHELGEVCRIGRDANNEIRLDDPEVSRKHCRVTREGGVWVLEDLRSANGTYRNEERVEKVLLRDGDRIRVGSTVLVFESGESGEPRRGEGAEADEARSFAVRIEGGPAAGRVVPIEGGRLRVGRRAGNDLVLEDPKVSGSHCELVVEEGHLVLRDLGSTNGTFLEGKRIDEVVVEHGDRVRVGDSVLVVVDLERPGPASSPEEAEQTLLDIPKPDVLRPDAAPAAPRRGGRGLAWLAVLVLLGAGAAAFVLQRRGAAPEAPRPEKGNRFGELFSFEQDDEAGDPFVLASGEGAEVEVIGGGARSGLRRLVLRVPGGWAEARSARRFEVRRRKQRLRAYARVDGEGRAVLAAAFFDGDGRSLGEVALDQSGGGEWVALEGEAVPPPSARSLEVRLLGVGRGVEVSFDDLGLFDAGSGASPSATRGAFEIESIGPVWLVWAGEPALAVGPPEALSTETEARCPGDRLLVGGELLTPDGGFALAVEADLEADRPRYTLRSGKAPAGWRPGLALGVFGPLLAEGVGILRGDRLDRYHDAFEVDGADALMLGGGSRLLRIDLAPAARLVGRPAEDSFTIRVELPEAGEVELTLKTDFVEEKTRAAELERKARRARAEGRPGEAIALADRILNEFPYDEATTQSVTALRNEILAEWHRVQERLDEAQERARFLASPDAYREAEEIAEQAARAFSGSSLAEVFEQRLAELAAARAALEKDARERQALAYLQRVESALAADPPMRTVALLVARALERRFPDTEAARRARELLATEDLNGGDG